MFISTTEGLKRDIKVFIEKAVVEISNSEKIALESQNRARTKAEDLIDLEARLAESIASNSNVKVENDVLSKDCERLVNERAWAVKQRDEISNKNRLAQKVHESLKREIN